MILALCVSEHIIVLHYALAEKFIWLKLQKNHLATAQWKTFSGIERCQTIGQRTIARKGFSM